MAFISSSLPILSARRFGSLFSLLFVSVVLSVFLVSFVSAAPASCSITVTSPLAGSTLSGVTNVDWTAGAGCASTFGVYYQLNGAGKYKLLTGAGAVTSPFVWDTITSVDGNYTLRVQENAGAGSKKGTSGAFKLQNNVIDAIPPVITLIGANPQVIIVGDAYVELNATVADNFDTGVDVSIDSSTVNTGVVGSYVVTYSATDASGNVAQQKTRTVNVVAAVDTTAPVIDAHATVTVVATSASGAVATFTVTATDNVDGSVTPLCSPVSGSTFTLGATQVTCTAQDSAGNNAIPLQFDVVVQDTTAPTISLVGSASLSVERNSSYSDAGATVSDAGDASVLVSSSGSVDTAIVGVYTLYYDAVDASGNNATQVTRTVTVVDSAPTITLTGGNVTIEYLASYSDAGATASDLADGDLTSAIVIGGDVVDSTILGDYVITYDVTDSGNNSVVQVTRTVTVVDSTIPVISLGGADPQTIQFGDSYVELGATVSDNYDTGLSAVSDASAVDTNTVGSYQVTYDATDSKGNNATQITRTVNVIDTTAPIITLTGDLVVSLALNASYSDAGATAQDNYDGNLDANVTVSGSVDTSKIGTFIITYDVIDANGNAQQLNRTVRINSYTSAGNVSLTFTDLPLGAYDVSVSESNETNTSTADFLVGGNFFEISSTLTNGNFNVTLTFTYADADTDGIVDGTTIAEGDLNVYYFDGTNWILIPVSARNATANTLSVASNHFTLFTLFTTVPVSSPVPSNVGGGGRVSGGTTSFNPVTSAPASGVTPLSTEAVPTLEATDESPAPATSGSSLLTGGVIGALGTTSGKVILVLVIILVSGYLILRMRRKK